ncbi:hypothetical protein LEP1GSC073_0952 [Leptospira noguchii str. Cascata]|nr:hypothetical protein LEP1GSC073_0952 [Leptospira noguchii str. Cascata]
MIECLNLTFIVGFRKNRKISVSLPELSKTHIFQVFRQE